MPDQTNITDFDPASGLTTTTLVSDHDRGSMDWAERQLGGLENVPMTPGGGSTNPPEPAPNLTGVAPATGPAATAITLTGTNFVTGAVVKEGSTALPTTFVSATSLTTAISAAATGAVSLTVTNPDGQVSGAQTFTVTAAQEDEG